MSEKVVLTQEQASAIEAFLRDNGNDKLHLVDWHNANKAIYLVETDYQPLMTLKASALATALFIGYELEKPKFQAGDKVIRKDGLTFAAGEFIWTVVEDQQDSWKAKVVGSSDGWDVFWETASIRHATPEEIYWLHELGRDSVGEFREGDVIITQEVSYRYSMDGEVDTIGPGTTKLWMDQGIIKGIYPVESFKPMKGVN